MTVDLQGQKANSNGKWLENEIENTLSNYGILSVYHKQIGKRFGNNVVKDTKAPAFLIKNVPYTNMFGGQSRGEFVLQIKNYGPIRIECRFQKVSGSVDEKIPYLIGNCYSFPEKDVILVLEGTGMREAARNFAKNAARAIAHKNIRIFTLNQFKAWARRKFEKGIEKHVEA